MLIQRKDTLCHRCILREPRNLVLNAQQTGIDSCLSRRGWFWRHGWGASCPGAVCRGGGHSDRPVAQLGRGGRSTRQCPSGCPTETQEPPAERKPGVPVPSSPLLCRESGASRPQLGLLSLQLCPAVQTDPCLLACAALTLLSGGFSLTASWAVSDRLSSRHFSACPP